MYIDNSFSPSLHVYVHVLCYIHVAATLRTYVLLYVCFIYIYMYVGVVMLPTKCSKGWEFLVQLPCHFWGILSPWMWVISYELSLLYEMQTLKKELRICMYVYLSKVKINLQGFFHILFKTLLKILHLICMKSLHTVHSRGDLGRGTWTWFIKFAIDNVHVHEDLSRLLCHHFWVLRAY